MIDGIPQKIARRDRLGVLVRHYGGWRSCVDQRTPKQRRSIICVGRNNSNGNYHSMALDTITTTTEPSTVMAAATNPDARSSLVVAGDHQGDFSGFVCSWAL
jgi:hypothetical protein